jgi:hypothetical protein
MSDEALVKARDAAWVRQQCVECAWRFINEHGHCYMFEHAPTELCMKRKTNLAHRVEPFVADTGEKS